MRRERIWIVGILLLGMSIVLFVSKRELINAYFSTVKLKFLTNYMETHYLYEVDEEAGLEGIYQGYLEGLGNRVTYYLEEDDLKAAQIQAEGNYFGTGLKLIWSLDDHSLTITDVLKDSMAHQGDLQVGDRIIAVDGIPVLLANRQDVINKVTSTSQDSITYTVERDNYTWDIVLSPSKVELQDVLSEMIEGILYIKLNTIKEETNVRFKEVIEETNFEECRGLILDVRNLSTQQLEEVVKISDLFLDEGIAFKVQTKSEGVRVFTVGELYYDMPLVVITNSETLGGAEALVLALRDRATILGSDTGGQIYSQKIIAFEDGTGMSVASGKICDQYGEALSKNGISPDIRVYLDEEDRLTKLEQGYLGLEDDTYLQRALTMFQ